jgi:hypothetical protein
LKCFTEFWESHDVHDLTIIKHQSPSQWLISFYMTCGSIWNPLSFIIFHFENTYLLPTNILTWANTQKSGYLLIIISHFCWLRSDMPSKHLPNVTWKANL